MIRIAATASFLFVLVTFAGCPPPAPPAVAPVAAFTAALPGEDAPGPGERIIGFDPQEVVFTDTSTRGTAGISVWQWNFGDGNTSEERHPLHRYSKAGIFTVTLRVVGPLGSSTATAANLVEIRPREVPAPNFSVDVERGLDPLQVRFTNLSAPGSAGSFQSQEWDFGDGTTSSVFSPTHEFTELGTFTVSLTVETALGMYTLTLEDLIEVVPPQSAAFTADLLSGFAPLPVQFTNLSEPGVDPEASFNWNFGDGSTSTQASPAHVYNVPGIYNVSLRVATALDNTVETKTRYIEVLPTAAPVAGFSAAPVNGRAPLFVLFSDASAAGTGASLSSAWDFGDGATSTEESPLHAYTIPGTYTVSLSVTTEHGADTETKNNLVTVTAAPVADFSATPEDGFAPLLVRFTDLSTPVAQITGRTWTFGDGSSSILATPSHRYVTPGIYTVALRVDTADGSDTETRSALITVRPTTAPTAAFAATPQRGTAPLTVLFTDDSDLGTGTQPEWAWFFGDEETEGEGEGEAIEIPPSSDEQSPQHIYTEPGLYRVTLTVTTEHGEDTRTRPGFIEVLP